jgi:DNA-binding beta-propeller fold protein YncE
MRNPRSASLCLGLSAAALLFAGAGATAAEPHYAVASRIVIGGEGGWDILTCDAPGRRLFVSHATHVVVVDIRGDSVIGDIPNTPGVHGIALAPDVGRGFTSNGRDSSVTVFDLKTLAVLANVKLPARNPDEIIYDPASRRVFTFNGGSANAIALDAKTNQVVGTVPLDGKPEFAVVDGAGHLWVNLEDSSAVVELDTRKLQVIARWPLAPGEEPTGLALDRAHHRLFSACGNQMLVVLDAASGRRIATVPIGNGVDGAEYDEARGRIFAPSGEGTLTVIAADGPAGYRVVENVATERGARTLALDPSTGTVYLPTADFGPPPEPTADRPHPRPSIVPGTFRLLVVKP